MALIYTTWQDWVARAGTETRLKQFAPGDTSDDHPRVEDAELAAIAEMNGYLRKRGYKLPLDSPLPPNVKQHLLSLGMRFLTIRGQDVPQEIRDAFSEAQAFFDKVSLGRMTIEDSNTATEEGTQDADILYVRTQRTFDFDDPTSPASLRMPKL